MNKEIELLKNEGDELMKIKPDIDNLPKPKLIRKVNVNKHTTVNFPEKMRVFGKTRAEILNFPDFSKLFKFPEIQKIVGDVGVKFPAVQKISGTVNAIVKFPDIFKVEVTNLPEQKEIVFPTSTKVDLTKEQQQIFKQIIDSLNFPLGQGSGVDSLKANPSRYINVRMTNGKQFIESLHSINANNGQLANLLKEINNKTSSSSGATDTTPTIFASGRTTVTTAGTQVQLSSNECKSITVKALITNTGKIYVGGSDVDSTNGFELNAGESMSIEISNTDKVWIDSSIDAQGVSYIYVN